MRFVGLFHRAANTVSARIKLRKKTTVEEAMAEQTQMKLKKVAYSQFFNFG